MKDKEKAKEVREIKRTNLYNSILSIVKQIPRENVESDAMDAPSCAYEIEQLFYKWQKEMTDKEKQRELIVEIMKGDEQSGLYDEPKKQTAVDWLFEELWDRPKDKMVWFYILEKAKQMEKEQIEEAWIEGGGYSKLSEESDRMLAEQYYKENYEKNEKAN